MPYLSRIGLRVERKRTSECILPVHGLFFPYIFGFIQSQSKVFFPLSGSDTALLVLKFVYV